MVLALVILGQAGNLYRNEYENIVDQRVDDAGDFGGAVGVTLLHHFVDVDGGPFFPWTDSSVLPLLAGARSLNAPSWHLSFLSLRHSNSNGTGGRQHILPGPVRPS
ncbi:hypothetical protein chiPu_0007403 [Chiloscyllium punctatum]|uniref:Uncharacterized protein n=1 Tax=Chiloscyllium punctatum TaxID=137246 RepID=A0A401SF04_CHIPU|nr:hypothetical protein [Chiloscyllium punctatum]